MNGNFPLFLSGGMAGAVVAVIVSAAFMFPTLAADKGNSAVVAVPFMFILSLIVGFILGGIWTSVTHHILNKLRKNK